MNERCTNVSNKVDWTLSRDSGVDWWWEDEPWAKSQLGVWWSGLVWGLIWLGSNKDKTQMSTWAAFCTLLYSEHLYSILLYSSELTPKWFCKKNIPTDLSLCTSESKCLLPTSLISLNWCCWEIGVATFYIVLQAAGIYAGLSVLKNIFRVILLTILITEALIVPNIHCWALSQNNPKSSE